MRRKKVDNFIEHKETIVMISELIPNDISEIRTLLDGIENNVNNFGEMKHNDFIESRKGLMDIQNKTKELRNTILEIHKIFTKENKPNDKL